MAVVPLHGPGAQLAYLFRGREDVYAEHSATRDDPEPHWHPVRQPLTLADLEAHVRGDRVLGVYLVHPDDTVNFGAADLDDEVNPDSTRELVYRLRDKLVELGVPRESTLLNFSGGKGHHLHLFASPAIAAGIMRRAIDIASVLAGLPEHEIFPKQDRVSDLGNLIKLPLAAHPKTGRRAEVVDVPDPDAWGWGVRPCDPAILHHLVRRYATVQRRATVDRGTEPPKVTYTTGQRHDRVVEIAGKANSEGWSLEAAERAALDENAEHFDPPLAEDEVRKHVSGIYERYAEQHRQGTAGRNGAPREGGGKKQSRASQLVDLVQSSAVELWHDDQGEPWATVEVQGHREHWAIHSRGFKRWSGRLLYEHEGATANAQALQDALNVLGGIAIYEGLQHVTHLRVAGHGDVVYLDLADEAWRAVGIDSMGWWLVDSPPVIFRRARGMLPLPIPELGGELEDLREYVNVEDDGWKLAVGWLLNALRPTGPYPVLQLRGEQGSAKTTTARMLRELVDPNLTALRAEPREVRDLMVAARNGWMVAFDNLSSIPAWLSDGLCRLSTGGGFATRELYSDLDETIIDATRPVLLTGIEGVAVRDDLVDRTITTDCPSLAGRHRREAELWSNFAASKASVLGSVLTALTGVLAVEPDTKLERYPRMADFALRSVAAEAALGWEPGSFLDTYSGVREAGRAASLEDSLIAPLVASLAARGGWQGTARPLLKVLEGMVDERVRKERRWPNAPNALSGQLRRLVPVLREEGWASVEFTQESVRGSRKIIKITKAEEIAERPTSSTSSTQLSLGHVDPGGSASDDGDGHVDPGAAAQVQNVGDVGHVDKSPVPSASPSTPATVCRRTLRSGTWFCARHLRMLDAEYRCPTSGEVAR